MIKSSLECGIVVLLHRQMVEIGVYSTGSYMSSSERAHNDPEARSVLEECREALEEEDVASLAQNSPNPYERAFYRKRL